MTTLPRTLEPEVMESGEDARDYDAMDHAAVNSAFVDDLLAALAECDRWLESGSAGRPFEILDAGTGTGLIPLELAGRCERVHITAIDISSEMLAIANRHIEQAGLSDRIAVRIEDCKELTFPDDHFDGVISNSLIHHLPRPETALAELLRVICPGGLLFLRDLARPASTAAVEKLVARYAGGQSPTQQRLFRDSLHAALTLSEVQEMLATLKLPDGTARMTSDRHWTVCAEAPTICMPR